MAVTKQHEKPGRGCACCPVTTPDKARRWARRTAKAEIRATAKKEGKR